MTYVYLMKNNKALSLEIIRRHVNHLRELDAEGALVLCGPFSDYPGGMVVVRAESPDEAKAIAEADPFISSGCKTYELRCLEVANAENNYLMP